MSVNADALDRMQGNVHHATCTIRLILPVVGNVLLKPTADRATEACGVTDAMKAGAVSFDEYLAQSVVVVADELDPVRRAIFDGWLATIPLDIIKRVRATVDRTVPRGHRCKDGGPHYNVCLRWVEDQAWGRVLVDGTTVIVFGPGP